MPVTTKAQLSAESGESENSVKPRMREYLSKSEKVPKSCDNLNGLSFLPAEPFLSWVTPPWPSALRLNYQSRCGRPFMVRYFCLEG